MSTPSNPLEGLDIKAGTQSGAAPLAANLAAQGIQRVDFVLQTLLALGSSA